MVTQIAILQFLLIDKPLPDCSTILPHPLPPSLDEYFTSLVGQPLYQATLLETNTHYCSASLQNLVGNSCLRRSALPQCLEEAEQQAETSGDVPPPLIIVISTTFCVFLFSLSLLPFSILSLLLFLISPSLSTVPPFSSKQFFVLLRQRLQVSFSIVYLVKRH